MLAYAYDRMQGAEVAALIMRSSQDFDVDHALPRALALALRHRLAARSDRFQSPPQENNEAVDTPSRRQNAAAVSAPRSYRPTRSRHCAHNAAFRSLAISSLPVVLRNS